VTVDIFSSSEPLIVSLVRLHVGAGVGPYLVEGSKWIWNDVVFLVGTGILWIAR